MFKHKLKECLRNKVWVIICAVSILITSTQPSILEASSYTTSYKLYRKGQFSKAISKAKLAYKKTKSRAEKAKILKLMGISSYMLGNKKNAYSYFNKALSLNPRINISRKEVLDPSIISYFAKVKKYKYSKSVAKKEKEIKIEKSG